METTAVSHATVCKRFQNIWTYSFTTVYNSDTVGRKYPQVKVLTAVFPTSKQVLSLAKCTYSWYLIIMLLCVGWLKCCGVGRSLTDICMTVCILVKVIYVWLSPANVGWYYSLSQLKIFNYMMSIIHH